MLGASAAAVGVLVAMVSRGLAVALRYVIPTGRQLLDVYGVRSTGGAGGGRGAACQQRGGDMGAGAELEPREGDAATSAKRY